MAASVAFEHVVVGAGVEGLAAACALAAKCKRGSVLCLDQYPLPHSRGSSMGQTRVTRAAYRHPQYVKMALQANDMWTKLEREFGERLYFPTGCVVVGEAGANVFDEYGAAMRQAGAECTQLSVDQLRRRYGHLMRFEQSMAGFHEPSGGLLLAAKCLTALQRRLRTLGGRLVDNCPVVGLMPKKGVNESQVEVQVADGRRFTASDSVVVAVGPWAPKFLAHHLDLHLPIEPHKTITLFWRELTPDIYAAQNGTPAVLFAERDHTFYFKPTLEYRGLLQYGAHLGMLADPEKPAAEPPNLHKVYVDSCRRVADKYGLKVDLSAPAVVENCFYTECVDKDFILDRHPRHSNIIIAAGFSGHGFKMAPVVGELLAALALNRTPEYDMSMFAIDRFDKKNRARL